MRKVLFLLILTVGSFLLANECKHLKIGTEYCSIDGKPLWLNQKCFTIVNVNNKYAFYNYGNLSIVHVTECKNIPPKKKEKIK
jgi:hypothetical protein